MVNARVKDGEHHTIVENTAGSAKQRKLDERQDIALVGLKRMVEHKKLDKIQSSLHLIDFPKQNNHIHFVSDPKELKGAKRVEAEPAEENEDDFEDIEDEGEEKKHHGLSLKYSEEKERYVEQLKQNLSENKKQYKKLADAIIKE